MRAWDVSGGALVLALQASLFALSYGFREITGPEVAWHVDHLYHLYQVSLSAALWRQGALTGFDPVFAAGYLGGATFNWSAKAPAALAWLGYPWLDAAIAYKIYIALSVVSAPVCIWLAARLARCSPRESLVAGFLGILIWWATYLSWYITAGMVAYAWSAFLALLLAVLIRNQCLARLRVIPLAMLALVSAGAWWVHPHFPLLVALFAMPLLVAAFGVKLRRVLTVGGGLAVTALLLNISWLTAMQMGGGLDGEGMLDLYGGYQREVALLRIFKEAFGQFGNGAAGAKLYPILLGASFLSAIGCSGERRRFAISALVVWLLAQSLAYGGGSVESIARLQPNRIAPAAYLLLVLPAVWGLGVFVSRLRANARLGRLGTPVAVALVSALLAYPSLEAAREALPGSHGRYGLPPPHFRMPTPLFEWLEQMVSNERPAGGRVLLEQSAARVFDGAHLAGLLALRTHAEFIGGPYASDNLVNFKDGRLLGRHVGGMNDSDLLALIDRYAVELILVHSEESKNRFARLPGVVFVEARGSATAYRRLSPESLFAVGVGRLVERKAGTLRFDQVGGRTVILKYHYLDALRAVPAHMLAPARFEALPSFLEILEPPSKFEITTRKTD